MTDEALREWLLLWVKDYCNNTWDTDPPGVILFLNQAVDYIKNQKGITSETIGDYSVTFVEAVPKSLLMLLRPYRKVKFI